MNETDIVIFKQMLETLISGKWFQWYLWMDRRLWSDIFRIKIEKETIKTKDYI